MRKSLFICLIISLIYYILFRVAPSVEADHGVTPNANCLGMHGTFNATNWPSGAAIDIACQGDTGSSGCDGSITENQTPGAVFHFPDCSCPPFVDGCLKIGSNLSLVRRNVIYPTGSDLSNGERFMADGDYSLPGVCTLRQTLACGLNGYSSNGVDASFTIDCSANLPTVTCVAKDASNNTITSINSGGTVYWKATGDEGSGTYTSYAWTGDGFSGTETTAGGSTSTKTKTYTNNGSSAVTKTASVTITDSSGHTSANPPATCSITVNTTPPPPPSPTPVPSTPSCSLSAVLSSTVASTQCPSGQTGRDVTGTITTSNITNSTISGVTWTMNGGPISNTCNGTGCLTKTFPCVGYTFSQSLLSQVQLPSDSTVQCSTIFDNPAPGASPTPEIIGSSGSFSNFRYHVDCSDNGHGNSQGYGYYNDTAYKIFTAWDWSGGAALNHYEAWVAPSYTNAWECYMGPSTSCSNNETITDAGYVFPQLDIYRDDKTTLINYAAKITANSSSTYATGQFTEFYMGYFYPARGIYKDSSWLSNGPLCPFDLVVGNANARITSPVATNNIRVGDQLSFEVKIEEQGLGLNAPSAKTRLSVFRQTDSGPFWIWDYDQTTENISHNQSRTPSWSNIAGLTSVRGNYLFKICANSDNAAPYEYSSSNNCGEGSYTVLPTPTPSPPPAPTVDLKVRRDGEALASAGNHPPSSPLEIILPSGSTTTQAVLSGNISGVSGPSACPIQAAFWDNRTAPPGWSNLYGPFSPPSLNFTSQNTHNLTANRWRYTMTCTNTGVSAPDSVYINVINNYNPWIQVDGDVHSNTSIDLSGGPP